MSESEPQMPQSAPPWATKAGASVARTITYSTSPAEMMSCGRSRAGRRRAGPRPRARRAWGQRATPWAPRCAGGGHPDVPGHGHGIAAAGPQDLLQALKRARKAAGSRVGHAKVREHRVVAAARGEARGHAVHVGLEDDARVVVEAVDDAEVEGELGRGTRVREARDEAAQLGGAAAVGRHAGALEQLVHAVDDACVAVQARQLVEGAGDRRGQAGGVDGLIERHEVRGVHLGEDLLAQGLVGNVCLEQGQKRPHRADDDADVGNLEGR